MRSACFSLIVWGKIGKILCGEAMAIHKLSAKEVKSLKEPGRYSDGGGLVLAVGPGNAKSWIMRIMQRGKRHDIGLGPAEYVGLKEARDLAYQIKKHAVAGGDVKEFMRLRRSTPEATETVEQAARRHFEEVCKEKKLARRTRDLWMSRLESFVFPKIGHEDVNDITPKHIKDLLLAIGDKRETAHRVRQRLLAFFDWAKVEGILEIDNPVKPVEQGKLEKNYEPKHRAALAWEELPAFMKDLSERYGSTARCLELLILTASRSIEVRGARWEEIDFEAAIWTVPAERMKGPLGKRKPHEVPLSPEAIEVLHRVQGLDPELVFPSPRGKVLSDMAFKSIFKNLRREITAHGFRSTFMDWARDNDIGDEDLRERALAHVVAAKTKRAYNRSTLFERRRRLMNEWSKYSFGKSTQ